MKTKKGKTPQLVQQNSEAPPSNLGSIYLKPMIMGNGNEGYPFGK